jgi:unsaturated rhamnogalacturonyl hydrolase
MDPNVARHTRALLLFFPLVGQVLTAGESAAPATPRALVNSVAEAVLRDFSQPPPFDWGEGVLLAGMIKAHRLTGDARYARFVERFADHWARQGLGPLLAQKGYCGHWGPAWALLLHCQTTGHQPSLDLARQVIDFMVQKAERTTDGGLSHFSGKPQLWVDTLAMACPVFSQGAHLLRRPDWQEQSERQMEIFIRHLQDTNTGLFYHMWDEKSGQRTSPFWARGNGWVVLTFVEVLDKAAPAAPAVARMRRSFERQLTALAPLQDPSSGLWHTVLDAPETPLETSATAMFLCGWMESRPLGLSPSPEAAVLRRAWKGLTAQVDAQGRVTGVSAGTTPGDKARYAKVPLGTYTWGTGAFLLAACAWAQAEAAGP